MKPGLYRNRYRNKTY